MWGDKPFVNPNHRRKSGWYAGFTYRLLCVCSATILFATIPGPNYLARATELLPICELQGEGLESPYINHQVRTRGVVTADLDQHQQKGFNIQMNDCDHLESTSDGIFIYLGMGADLVRSGDLVEVSGVVNEYHGLTEISSDASQITVLSGDNSLPTAFELNPPLDNALSKEYFESHEGMLIQMQSARVVGSTDHDGHTWVVRTDLDTERIFYDDPRGTGEVISIGDGGLFALNESAKVSDQIENIYGVLDEADGVYTALLLRSPSFSVGELPPNDQNMRGEYLFSLATFNLRNLFDTLDDPDTDDDVFTSAQYQRKLNKLALAIHGTLGEPDLLVVQEAENLGVLRDLALRPEIITEYDLLWEDTPDPRGQDTALLYRRDKFAVLDHQIRQGCTLLIDGLGPDGNQDVEQPSNSITCDRNGDGKLEGNRLFSRPVLIVHLQVIDLAPAGRTPIELILIINHWKSKTEDTPVIQYTLPRRLEEAEFVAALAGDLSVQYPTASLIVAGDLNDVPGSGSLLKLNAPWLLDLTARVEKLRRYSLIYQGVSQVFDYIIIKPTVYLNASSVSFRHINSDYPADLERVAGTEQRSSDHDPLVAYFVTFSRFSYLPMIRQGK